MGEKRPRKISGMIMGMFIIFSTLAVMNFASTNARADWNTDQDWVIENEHVWNESVNITLTRCNLIIKSGGILTFNNSVLLEIICDENGEYGITIEPNGTFEINSSSANTVITYGSSPTAYSYSFLNSGTIDFLGANVTRVYGDSYNPDTTGGIRNLPGSTCNLTNCNIMDGDTHGIYAEGDSELNIANCTITNTTSNVLDGTGIQIKGNSNVLIDSVSVFNMKNEGIKIADASNVTIKGSSVIKNSNGNGVYIEDSEGVVMEDFEVRDGLMNGIYLDDSNATITNVNIHDNANDGIVVLNGSAPEIESNNISGNDGYGIRAENSIPIIQNNPFIEYNGHGIYVDDIWDGNAKIDNNTISNNVGIGIYANNTNITIFDNRIDSNGLEIAYGDDFETDTGWTTDSSMWHRINGGDTNAPAWNISYNGDWSYWYGNDTTGDYNNGTRNWGNLTSEEIEVCGTNDGLLTFMSWSDVNETSGDVRWIQVKSECMAWENVTEIQGDPMGQWVLHTVDISDFIPAYSIQLRFCFDSINATDNDQSGWYVDDVSIRVPNFANKSLFANHSYGILVNNSSSHIFDNTFNLNDYAVYCLESTIVIENNTFDGNVIAIKGNETDLTIKFNEITNQTNKGIYIIGSTVATIFYNDIWNNSGIAIYSEESYMEIFDCNITNNFDGIFLTERSNASVHNNILVENRCLSAQEGGHETCGVDMEDNSSAVINNNLMIDNKVGIYINRSYSTIYNNTIIEEPVPEGFTPIIVTAIYVRETVNLSIYQNWIASWIYGNSGMIDIKNSHLGINVYENKFEGQFEGDITYNFRGMPIKYYDLYVTMGPCGCNSNGIKLWNSSAVIQDNIVNGTYQSGIYLNGSSYASISNNTITNSAKHGINVGNSTANITNCNYVCNNLRDGIYSYNSSVNVNNSIISRNENGICLILSSNNTITNNTISENDGSGIWIETCSGEITGNTIGISCGEITNETVYGPTLGGGEDPSTIYLDHGNILNCSLYIDLNGTQWYPMEEESDYTLNYETGDINITNCGQLDENWTFYAYYNYTGGNNQTGIFVNNDQNYSLELKIELNQIENNMDDGIQALGANVTVLNNTILENVGSGLWMENCTGEISNNTIMENHETPSGGGPPGMSGIDLINCDEVYVGYNNVSWNDVNIYLENSRNVTVEWNEMEDESAVAGGTTPRGIYSVSSQMIASNNTIRGTCIGIDIEDADDETILADNNFYRSDPLYPSTGAEIGIKLTNASSIIQRNLFDGIKTGIRCLDNSSAYIHNNTIINCSQDGIYMEWSNATIVGNNISGNGGWGIISKFVAPANAGANGTDIAANNTLNGNTLGMATQLWQMEVLVWNGTGGVPYKYIMVNDTYNNTAWDGYTNGQGIVNIVLSQYEIIDLMTRWNYTPYSVYTDNSGMPAYTYNIILDDNVSVIVYIT